MALFLDSIDWALKSERLKGGQVKILFTHDSVPVNHVRGESGVRKLIYYTHVRSYNQGDQQIFKFPAFLEIFESPRSQFFVDRPFNRFLLLIQLNIIDKNLKIPNPTPRATLSKGFSDWGEIIRIISHRQISVFLYLLDSY